MATIPPAGTPVHSEYASNDTAATRKWLTDVFGITFMDMSNDGFEYHTFGDEETGIGGAVRPVVPEEAGPNTTSYLSTTDLDATITKAQDCGANMIVPKTPVPGFGWFAWFMVPGDVVIAAWQNDANAPAPDAPPA